jgi:HEAT repeat protein
MRIVVRLLVVLACAVALGAPPAVASPAELEFHDCAFQSGLGNGECQHFLRNPLGVTDDPCWCDKCRNALSNQHHDGHTIPPGWNQTIFEQGNLECYLKRHAVAWGITCSECFANDKPWPDGGGGSPGTAPATDFEGRPARETVLARLEIERKLFRRPEGVVLAYDRHFYMVTDVENLKVRTQSGGVRPMGRHEWIHQMLERAEYARREWVRNLGEPKVLQKNRPRPIAIYIPQRWKDFEKIGATYFKNAGSRGLRGPIAELCDGMCLSGITFSVDEAGGDHGAQVHMRHEISHNLLAMWGSFEVRPKSMPVWMEEGLAHWLVKTDERFKDDVFYCMGEGLGGPSKGTGGAAWSGGKWQLDLERWIQTNKLSAIEDLLGQTVIGNLTEQDQKRAWSLIDVCLQDVRGPFAKTLAALRQEKSVREAFTENLGCTPEQLDERWRDRVVGKRRSVSADAGPAEADDTPGARDRRSIARETDPHTLSSKIRQLGEIKDAKTIPVVVDVIERNLDLPRETAFVTLLGVTDPACRQAIWRYGLGHANGIVRAYVARICARLALSESLPKLEAQLADENWYARAEAAVACGTMKDAKAMSVLRKMVDSDASDKARVAAMDALAMFGEEATMSVPLVAKLLDSPQWQLRIVAVQTLGDIGSMEGVEPLLERMETEPTGRIADEIFAALRKISRDDLGRKPENWRRWWHHEKASASGGLPQRPKASADRRDAAPAEDAHATHDGAPAPYFGMEIYSNRVAFVCDSSESMLEMFTPDPAAAKALSRQYVGHTKLSICKEEVAQALSGLDPRAYFNIISFGTQIRPFKETPIQASPGNVAEAKRFLQGMRGYGETNYYDALKAALDIGDEPDTNPSFRPTPDTITFLTDGEPTKGDILDADVILEWFTGLNRYARVKTHTITFGLVGVDLPLLRGMADRNGGRFTLVPEQKGPAGPKPK